MVCCWLLQASAARDFSTADGISYLDIAHSCVAGHWHALVSGWWSPAFPFLLTICLKIFKPDPYHEASLVHLLAFVSLIAALASFEYFLAVFLKFRAETAIAESAEDGELIPERSLLIVGYALFFWIRLSWSRQLWSNRTFSFLFCTCWLPLSACKWSPTRVSCRATRFWPGIRIGVSDESVMFPLGFVFYVALLLQRNRRRMLPGLVLSVAIFVAVCAPFVLALSKSKGRFTFSDVGVMAYRHVMGADEAPLLPDVAPKPRMLSAIQDYTRIIHLGTYPPWSDPSYGYRATPFRFNLRRQINRTHVVLRYYFDLFVVQLGALATAFLVLFFAGSPQKFAKRLTGQQLLWLPAIAGLAFYATMRAEGRFFAGYAIALFAASAAALRLPGWAQVEKFIPPWPTAWRSCCWRRSPCKRDMRRTSFRTPTTSRLAGCGIFQELGIKNGDRVGYIGYALIDHAWAHVAGVRISAEIPDSDVANFWAAGEQQREEAVQWIAATSAKVVVTRKVPDSAMAMGWTKIGDTDYYVLRLAQNAAR